MRLVEHRLTCIRTLTVGKVVCKKDRNVTWSAPRQSSKSDDGIAAMPWRECALSIVETLRDWQHHSFLPKQEANKILQKQKQKETKRRTGGAIQRLSDKMESEWPESNQRPIDFREYCRHSIQHYSQSLYQLSYTRSVACYLNKLIQYAARASTHTTTHPASHSTSYQRCRVLYHLLRTSLLHTRRYSINRPCTSYGFIFFFDSSQRAVRVQMLNA